MSTCHSLQVCNCDQYHLFALLVTSNSHLHLGSLIRRLHRLDSLVSRLEVPPFLSPPSLNEVPLDRPQIPGCLVNQLLALCALLQSLEQRLDMIFLRQLWTRSSMPEMSQSAKSAVLHSGHFQSTPSHRMHLIAR